MFEGASWYDGLGDGPLADPPAAAPEPAPAPAADIEAQKLSLLQGLLAEVEAKSKAAAAPPPQEPPASPAPAAAAADGDSPGGFTPQMERLMEAVASPADGGAPATAGAAPPIAAPGSAAAASANGGSGGRRVRLLDMRPAQVAKALRRLGLGEHAAAFERHSVDGRMCDLLDDDLLSNQLGVRRVDQRQSFLLWVQRMQPPPRTFAAVD